MAVTLSNSDRVKRVRVIQGMLASLLRSAKDIDRLTEQMKDENQAPGTIFTNITALLTDWDALRDQIATELSNISEVYQTEIYVGLPNNLRAMAFLPCSGSKSVIQPLYATTSWNALFDADDIIRITNAEDSGNNTAWKVLLAPTGGVDTFTTYIVNGDMGSATGWTVGANWAIGSGVATHTAGATNTLSQAVADLAATPIANSVFYVTFTVAARTAGTLTVSMGGSYSLTVSANGTYKVALDYSGAGGLVFTPTSAFDGTVDTVSAIAIFGLVVEAIPSTGALTENQYDTTAIITLEEDN